MSSILSTIPLYVLANSQALNHLLDTPGQGVDWKLWAYSAFTQRDSTRPDHVFMQRWERYEARGGVKNGEINLSEAIRLVAEGYLEISNGRLYVRNQSDDDEDELAMDDREERSFYAKSAHFDRWQNIRARMTTWPLKLYMLHRHHCPVDYFLAHPLESAVADFIRDSGLNETHLHLNGCLYPEEEWLHDLYDVEHFKEKEVQAFRSARIREHYINVNPMLDPVLAVNRLKLAASLRDSILCLEQKDDAQQGGVVKLAERTIRRYSLSPRFFAAPLRIADVPQGLQKRKQQEMQMWMRAFELLHPGSQFLHKNALQSFLHLYLLLQNEHIALNCHAERRKGFEAFSVANEHIKLAVGNDEYYQHAFYKLLKTAEAQAHNYIEVRVTPNGLHDKWQQYLRCYESACQQWQREKKNHLRMNHELPPQSFRHPQLVLVAHMIKFAPKKVNFSKKVDLLKPLFNSECKAHMAEAATMAKTACILRQNYRISVALDAANSELNQAPEVFAPAYRLFELLSGISYKTYHCGEDFLHLISGIRAVYEAVTFLNLRNGNRIGHGIAIGIHPREWAETMPSKLLVSKREWLLNMILVWKLLHDTNPAAAAKAEREAVRVAGLIFSSEPQETLKKGLFYASIHILSPFFDMRRFVPKYVRKWLDGAPAGSPFREQEWKQMDAMKEQFGTSPAELFWQWNINFFFRKAQEEMVEVKRDFLNISELLELQQCVQHLIAVRDVVIETLPVSNLRIGQISHIQDHHVLRWLKVGKYKVEGDADMNICMGSDDPGIFATDLKNEYYHLYMCLRNAGVPAHEAVEKLRRVNTAGRVFAFSKLPDMNPSPFRLTSLLNNTPRPLTLRDRLRRRLEHREQEGDDPYDFGD